MTTEVANDVTGISAWLGRIVCGDNTELLSRFPAECVDLVVTSPPYDDLRTYGGHSWNFYGLAWQLVRVLKPGGVLVWVVADKTENGSETCTSMKQVLHFRTLGLRLHDSMVWWRTTVPCANDRYQPEHEMMYVLSRGKPKTINLLTEPATMRPQKRPGVHRDKNGANEKRQENYQPKEMRPLPNVWWLPNNVNPTGHPAQFPVALAKRHILTWSAPGDVVLDPFSGSGTTCLAAKELNREWCGLEINREYVRMAEARLVQDVLQLETCAMRPNGLHERPGANT